MNGLDLDMLRRLAAELLRRQPAVFADLINGEMAVYREPEILQPDPEAAAPHPDPQAGLAPHVADLEEAPAPNQEPAGPQQVGAMPDWCNCGQCAAMPTQAENKCCCASKMQCITTSILFQQLVLDGNVLDLTMRRREDVLALDHPRNNENFRHTAYRQYILWQHGRLGKGNRRVVPSCCVLAIRRRYPSASGIYTGYRPSRL